MSHDQRPERMRVVRNSPSAEFRRHRDDPLTAEDIARMVAKSTAIRSGGKGGSGVLAMPSAAPAADRARRIRESGALPLFAAILFLLACIGGGAAVAMLRPFGIG